MTGESIPSFNPTAQKLRFWVPSALRAPAAGYLQRYVPNTRGFFRLLTFTTVLAFCCKTSYAEPVSTKQEEMDQLRNQICDNPLVFPRRFYIGSKGSEVFDKYLREFDLVLKRAFMKSSPPGHGYTKILIEIDSKGNLISTKIEKSSNNQKLNDFIVLKIRENSPYKPFNSKMIEVADEVVFLRSFNTPSVAVTALESDTPAVSKQELEYLRKHYDDLHSEYKKMYKKACGRPVQ